MPDSALAAKSPHGYAVFIDLLSRKNEQQFRVWNARTDRPCHVFLCTILFDAIWTFCVDTAAIGSTKVAPFAAQRGTPPVDLCFGSEGVFYIL